MSENTGNSTYRSPLTRKTGVGLTRTNLSRGLQDTSQRISRETPLLKPSRLIISGSSLGPRRTNSDHYSNGYSRLGGLKNVSAPNISSTTVGKNKSDINQNIELPQRKSLTATNTSELLKSENVSKEVKVQRSESDNRRPVYSGRGTETERINRGPVYSGTSTETDRGNRGPVYSGTSTETDRVNRGPVHIGRDTETERVNRGPVYIGRDTETERVNRGPVHIGRDTETERVNRGPVHIGRDTETDRVNRGPVHIGRDTETERVNRGPVHIGRDTETDRVNRGPVHIGRDTETERVNRGPVHIGRDTETERVNRGPVYIGRDTETDKDVRLTSRNIALDNITQKDTDINLERSNCFKETENYVLALEEDEEDAVLEVKDSVDGTKAVNLEMTSLNSPSKDYGYSSPRVQTNVDSFSTSGLGSRSPIKFDAEKNDSPKHSPSQDSSSFVPERPVRSKHSAKKQNIDKSKLLSQTVKQSPWQQGSKTSIYDTTKTSESCKDKSIFNNDFSKENSLPDDQRSRSQVREEGLPVAKPRTHRRLTRRSISFKRLEDDEYIGFASLPEQVHRKAVRRGFEFTLMVVGETGLGKSTLINSLFLTDLYKDRKVGNIEERIQKTVELEKKELEIEERGVKLKLTIVDTPGFSDAVNAEESWKPIVNYIDKQFDGYFTAESGLNRKNIQDTRVHCCLYFISPYGHGLRPVDVMVMKKLHHKVNIIPLIAKSDMLTKQEVKRLKERVLVEIQKHNIQIYQYPDCDSDEDEEFKHQDKELKKSIPFAVVGSNTVVEAGGRKIRGRMYPWGIVEVENPVHSDFIKLRQMLISTHMQDLKDVTCDVHYENYRAEHISEQLTTTQRERGKLKRDSAANLESSLATEKLLQEKEAEIRRMQEMLVKMQAQLQNNGTRPNGRVGHV